MPLYLSAYKISRLNAYTCQNNGCYCSFGLLSCSVFPLLPLLSPLGCLLSVLSAVVWLCAGCGASVGASGCPAVSCTAVGLPAVSAACVLLVLTRCWWLGLLPCWGCCCVAVSGGVLSGVGCVAGACPAVVLSVCALAVLLLVAVCRAAVLLRWGCCRAGVFPLVSRLLVGCSGFVCLPAGCWAAVRSAAAADVLRRCWRCWRWVLRFGGVPARRAAAVVLRCCGR